MIDRCTFLNNNYSNAILKLEVQTKVLILSNLNFAANTNKEGVIHILFYSTNFSVLISMYNIILERNFDTSAGGVVLRYNSNDYSTIQASKLNFTKNHFIGEGGGINILGTLQKGCQMYIKSSHFINNFGFSPGSVIHSSIACLADKTYLIFIDNCIVTHNNGKSMVYVCMEHYFLQVFLVLNAEFYNNTGTPLQLFNVILVGNGVSRFHNNRADVGAVIYLRKSYLMLNFTSFQFDIRDHLANEYGGAIYIDLLFTLIFYLLIHI